MLYAVLKNPALRERAQAEADALFAGGAPDAAKVRELDVLHRIMLEALRMYTPVPGVQRKVTTSFDFAGHRIPAGEHLFFASMQRTAASRSVSGGSFADLNEDLLGDETLVAYAAAAGTTAADGRGRNSPYTAALLSHLETPLEIGLLFRRVRAQVPAATNGAQRPHEYHSLVGEHYLTRTLATGTSVTVSADPADPPRPDPPNVDVTELPLAALRELAEAGDLDAQTELGERYQGGYGGVRRDCAEAARWYHLSAEQGHALGQAYLGFMYSNGRGVQQDYREAVRWYASPSPAARAQD